MRFIAGQKGVGGQPYVPGAGLRQTIRVKILFIILWFIQAGIAQTPTSESLSPPPYHFLMERLLNPRLTSLAAVTQWQKNFPHRLKSLEQNFQLNAHDLQLAHNLQNMMQDFETAESHVLREHIFFAFLHKKWQDQQLIRASQQAYQEIAEIFEKRLHLRPPEGMMFVLVMERPGRAISAPHEAGYTLRASRFIVMYYAYYRLEGTPIPDVEGFYQTIKHEFVHAFINARCGYPKSVWLPSWFHEMAALALSGNPRIRIRGETISTLPDNYQEYYNGAVYLRKHFGQDQFDEFIRRSIESGDPQAELQRMFGIASFTELRRLSRHPLVSLLKKIKFKWHNLNQYFWQEKSYLPQYLFLSLSILLAGALFYYAIRENLEIYQKMNKLYRTATGLYNSGALEPALDVYHKFLETAQHAKRLERILIRSERKQKIVVVNMNHAQQEIYQRFVQQIEAVRDSDVLEAEALVYQLEELAREKFTRNYREEVEQYLQQQAAKIISRAWEARQAVYPPTPTIKDFLKILQDVLDYALQHRYSAYLPGEFLLKEYQATLNRWIHPRQLEVPVEKPCACRLDLTGVERFLKTHGLTQFQPVTEIAIKKLDLLCKYEEIEVLLDGSADDFELHILITMFSLVDIYHTRPALSPLALQGIYMLLSPDTFPYILVDQFDRILLFVIIKEIYKELSAILAKF